MKGGAHMADTEADDSEAARWRLRAEAAEAEIDKLEAQLARAPERTKAAPRTPARSAPAANPAAQAAAQERGAKLGKALSEMVKQYVERELARHEERIAKALDAVEAKAANGQMAYRGVWRGDVAYKRGQCCTHKGSLWFALTDHTNSRPGDGVNRDWQLAVKRGRNGRDAGADDHD
jgi:hypothetical protein